MAAKSKNLAAIFQSTGQVNTPQEIPQAACTTGSPTKPLLINRIMLRSGPLSAPLMSSMPGKNQTTFNVLSYFLVSLYPCFKNFL